MTDLQTWFVTGANRGLGAAITKAALGGGHNVVATARRAESVTAALGSSDALLAEALDITDSTQIAAAVTAAETRFGRIDVLMNNAGYGQLGLFEETSLDLVKRQIQTNLYGTMEVTRAVLPLMRKQRSGHIVTTSSISGTVGVAGSSIYSASKFAIEGWMEGLRQEVAPFGITATIVEPGYFKTDFLDGSSVNHGGDIVIEDYAEKSAAVRKAQEDRNHQQTGDPDKLAQAILDLVASEQPPLRLVAGADAVSTVERILAQRRSDLDIWRDTSTSLGL